MARNKSEWPAKVLALVRGGNLTAAIAPEQLALPPGKQPAITNEQRELPVGPSAAAERTMAVLRPVKLVITNYPAGKSETFEVENNPTDPASGTHEITFSRECWIEADDFMEVPVPKYKRLTPNGPECRLKGAYLITCTGCKKDENGNVVEVYAEYDPNSPGGDPADGRKVKGATLHWVDAESCVDAEVRLYDNLFSDPQPDGPDKDFLNCLNPDSLMVLEGCKVERAMVDVAKRFDQDISAVCAAFAFELDGERIVDARIAFGGMAATPQRATQTETFLRNQAWTEDNLVIAMRLLADDYAPLSDMRASNTYRMTTAQNLLRRFWLETRPGAPLPPTSLNAYACRA